MKRSLPVAIILSIVTCGIYSIYWFIVLTDDVNALSRRNDTSGAIAFLLTLVTCGIYGIYWAYQLGKKTGEMKAFRGVNGADDSIVYLLLTLFGFNIITMALAQNEINTTIDVHDSMYR